MRNAQCCARPRARAAVLASVVQVAGIIQAGLLYMDGSTGFRCCLRNVHRPLSWLYVGGAPFVLVPSGWRNGPLHITAV